MTRGTGHEQLGEDSGQCSRASPRYAATESPPRPIRHPPPCALAWEPLQSGVTQRALISACKCWCDTNSNKKATFVR